MITLKYLQQIAKQNKNSRLFKTSKRRSEDAPEKASFKDGL